MGALSKGVGGRGAEALHCQWSLCGLEEDIKGSIEVGKLADLVVLEADPNRVDPFAIKDIQVERTILGGDTVFQA